jgi:serine/threonine protein kinase
LGRGGYGVVRGPSPESVKKYMDQPHKGIRKSRLDVRKTYHKEQYRHRALELDKLISSFDPSRDYLKSPVVRSSDPSTIDMKNQGESLFAYDDLLPIFENAYQLVLALYVLYRAGGIHKDIKSSNIAVDDRSPTGEFFRMGLIDFDLATRAAAGSHQADRYNQVWPMEMFVHCTEDRPVFCIFPSRPIGRRRMECTENMLSIWNEQCRIISRLVSDPAEKNKLFDVGCAAIVHYNYPDAGFLEKKKQDAAFLYEYNPTPEFAENLEKMEQLCAWKQISAGMTADYSRDPIVKEYIKAFFGNRLCAPLDWSKIDVFSLGLVFIDTFLYKDGLQVSDKLRECLFGMVHPDPTVRYNAPKLLQEWLEVLLDYGDKSLLRRALVEIQSIAADDIVPSRYDSIKRVRFRKKEKHSPGGG